MMTGSGSVVYGAFERCADAVAAYAALEALASRRGWGRVWLTRTLPRGETAPCRAGKKALQSPDKQVIMLSRTGLKGPYRGQGRSPAEQQRKV